MRGQETYIVRNCYVGDGKTVLGVTRVDNHARDRAAAFLDLAFANVQGVFMVYHNIEKDSLDVAASACSAVACGNKITSVYNPTVTEIVNAVREFIKGLNKPVPMFTAEEIDRAIHDASEWTAPALHESFRSKGMLPTV